MSEEKVIHSPNCIYDPLTGRGNPCSCGAAADAGPRQPDTCKDCGEPIDWVDEGHFVHRKYDLNCLAVTQGRWPEPAAPPVPQEPSGILKQMAVNNLPQGAVGVPQEAAPQEARRPILNYTCPCCGEEYAVGVKCDLCNPVVEPEATVTGHNNFTVTDTQKLPLQPATAPDWAMRVAFEKYARPEGYRLERKRFMISGQPMFGQYEEDVTQSAWESFMAGAAMIREAGSERELREALQRCPFELDSGNRMVMRFTRAEWKRLLGGESK